MLDSKTCMMPWQEEKAITVRGLGELGKGVAIFFFF